MALDEGKGMDCSGRTAPDSEAEGRETARLAAIQRLGILDTAPEERFDVFTRLAATIMDMPISTLSLIDADRVWFKSTSGLAPDVKEVPRSIAACAHVIATPNEVMVVPDARKDPRIKDSPLVTGPLGVRFYAGAPLFAPGGEAVGALCVIDTRPRDDVDGRLVAALRELATGVSAALRVHELATIAFMDPLTGLGNRRGFEDQVSAAVADAREDGSCVGLMLIDLDRFKAVNDLVGHAGGDAALRIVAQRVTSALRQGDFACRLGGDEFAVVMPRRAPEAADAEIDEAARAIIAAVNGTPITFEQQRVATAATGGAAVVRPRDRTLAEPRAWLERAADVALYNAKKTNRGGFAFYGQGMQRGIGSKRTLASDIKAALAGRSDDLHVVLQPVCTASSREIRSFEALLRWNHHEHGRIAPLDFIPVAERSGLAPQLDAWVLRAVCGIAARWREGTAPIAVNVTPATLADGAFVGVVKEALAATGLAPSALIVEMTERMFVDYAEAVAEAAHALRAMGIPLALDDFGAGHAAFASLKNLPFDMVKLDATLTSGIERPDEEGARLRAVGAGAGSMAHALGAGVIAEGVETEAQFRELVLAGCDAMQGWLLGAPAQPAAWMPAGRKGEART